MSTEPDDDKPRRKAIPLRGLTLLSPDGVTTNAIVSLPAEMADQVDPAIINRHRVGSDPDDQPLR